MIPICRNFIHERPSTVLGKSSGLHGDDLFIPTTGGGVLLVGEDMIEARTLNTHRCLLCSFRGYVRDFVTITCSPDKKICKSCVTALWFEKLRMDKEEKWSALVAISNQRSNLRSPTSIRERWSHSAFLASRKWSTKGIVRRSDRSFPPTRGLQAVWVPIIFNMPSRKQFKTDKKYNAYFKKYRDDNRDRLRVYWREYKRKQKLKEVIDNS